MNSKVEKLIMRGRDRAFDLRHGIDSAGDTTLDGFTPVGPNAAEATYYSPADPVVLQRALSLLHLDFPRYTFIDLGSGKGRSVLLAARWPFRCVIGVEFVRQFHDIASANLRRWPASKISCEQITLLCEDAATYEFPPGPLVLYMFNPFNGKLVSRVMGNLAASIRLQPRDAVILYVNPKYEDAVLATPAAHLLCKTRYFSLYRLAAA